MLAPDGSNRGTEGEEAGMTEGGFQLWQKRTGMTAKPVMTTKSGGAFPSHHSRLSPFRHPDRLPFCHSRRF